MGFDTCYGHHASFEYESRPDPFVSYSSGYPIETAWRLARVSVESSDLATGDFVHTRDYDLEYDSSSHFSLLASVRLYGRDRAISLPAMSFEYTSVAGKTVDGGYDSDIPGFGGVDGTIHSFAASPPHSVDEGMSDLFDANHDGFADLLVTDPAGYGHGHGHGLYINMCDTAGSCWFEETDEPVMMEGGLPVGSDFSLDNTNVNPLDIDSDGVRGRSDGAAACAFHHAASALRAGASAPRSRGPGLSRSRSLESTRSPQPRGTPIRPA